MFIHAVLTIIERIINTFLCPGTVTRARTKNTSKIKCCPQDKSRKDNYKQCIKYIMAKTGHRILRKFPEGGSGWLPHLHSVMCDTERPT